jgi:hypothetical protein
MKNKKIGGLLVFGILLLALAIAAEARTFYSGCFNGYVNSTINKTGCTYTSSYGTSTYVPGSAPPAWAVTENSYFPLQYSAAGYETVSYSIYLDSNVFASCAGGGCNYTASPWQTECIPSPGAKWHCSLYYNSAYYNSYYVLTDDTVMSYVYISQSGVNNPPAIMPVVNLTYNEDAGTLSNIVDMWAQTADDKTVDESMTFALISQTNTSVISCSVNSGRYISCTTQTNAFGSSNITYRATDLDSASSTDTFRIDILPVNDIPTAPNSSYLNANNQIGQNLTITGNGSTDVDNDPITYMPEFRCDNATGTILQAKSATNYWTINASCGSSHTVYVLVWANDGTADSASYQTLTRLIANAAPVITQISNQSVNENLTFNYQVNCTDADGNPLNYYDNTSLFNINATGFISDLPVEAEVGIYSISVICSDGNLNTSSIFNYTIVNLAPVIFGQIPNQTKAQGASWQYDFNTTDDTDNIVWAINSSLISINSTSGMISDTPAESEAGIYSIRVNVTDIWGASALQTFIYTVQDTVAPTISFINNTPANNTYLNSNNLTINISHSEPNPLTLVVFLNGTANVSTAYSGNSTAITVPGLADGTYTYYVFANDTSGNFNQTETRIVNIDITLPAVDYVSITGHNANVFSPQKIDALYDTIDIFVNATEQVIFPQALPRGLAIINSTGGIAKYFYTSSFGNSINKTWDGKNSGGSYYVPDGNYTINATLQDIAGNTATYTVGSIIVDNSAPVITDNSGLLPNTYYNTTKIINITFSDMTNFTANIFVNGTLANFSFGGNMTLLYNLSSDGNYTYFANATDIVNNTNSTAPISDIIIDLTSPSLEIDALPDLINVSYILVTGNYTELNPAVIIVNGTAANFSGGFFNATISLAEGNNTIIAAITDNAGNAGTDSDWVVVDTLSPIINFNYPLTSENFSTNITINITASDAHLDTIQLWVNGTAVANVTSGTTFGTALFNLSDGTYIVNATVNDSLGHTNITETRIFVIDTTLPIISMDPIVQLINTTQYNITGAYIEANLKNITVNGTLANVNETNFWANISLTEGNNTIIAIARDILGNSAQIMNWTVVDTINPYISFNSPLSGNYSSNQTINITASDAHLGTIQLWVNGSAVANVTSGTTFGTALFNLSDGNYTVYATVNDTIGHTNITETRIITIDTIAPYVQFVLPTETNDSVINIGAIDTNVTAADPNFANITTYLYNTTGLIIAITNTSTDAYNLFTGLPDGDYFINATAYDIVGRANSTETRTVNIDTRNPLISFVAPTNSTGNYSQNFILANVSVSDANPENVTIFLYNLSGLINSTTGNANYPFFINFTNLIDGIYYLNATANDTVQHLNSTQTFTILLDTVSPYISFNSPPSSGNYSSNLTINITASDANLGTIQLWVNGNAVVNSTTGEALFNISDGIYVVNATVNDILGHTNFTETRIILIDTTIPIITMDAVNQLINRSWYNVSGTYAETNLVNITVNGQLANASAGTYWAVVGGLFDGNNTLNATVTDIVGNTAWIANWTFVDTIAPSVVDNMPIGTGYCNTTKLINITFADANNITAANIYVNGSVVNSSTGNVTLSFILSNEGNFTYFANATDIANNVNATTPVAGISIDLYYPLVSFVNPPQNGTYALNQIINVTAFDRNLVNITIYNSSTVLRVCTASPCNYTLFQEGNFMIYAEAYDIVGRQNLTETLNLTIDKTSPSIQIDSTSIQNNANISVNNFLVNITADDSSLANITIYLYNTTNIVNATTSITSPFALNFTLPDERYYFNATAYDAAGKSNSTETRTVLIDTTLPTITINPIPQLINTTQYNITGTFIEANIVNITVNGNLTTRNGNNYWALINLSEGNNTINATITDIVGLVNSAANWTFVDITKPYISFNSPASGNYNANQTINISASDIYLDTIQLWINGQAVVNTTPGATSVFYNLSDGNYTVYATVNDTLGHTNTTETRNILVDTVYPAWNPLPNATLSAEYGYAFSYDVNATDSNGIITYAVNNTNFTINTNGLITDNTFLAMGIYDLMVNATDIANNTNSTTISITVNDTLAPSVTNSNIPLSTYFNQSFNITVDAFDFNLANVTAELINSTGSSLYNWSMNLSTGITYIYTVPNNTLSAGNYNVTYYANDTLSHLNDTVKASFTIVGTVNTVPNISIISNSPVSEGQTLYINVSSYDPEGATPSIILNRNGTQVATAAGNLLQYSWTTNNTDSGAYNFTASTTDGILTNYATSIITVNNQRIPGFVSVTPANTSTVYVSNNTITVVFDSNVTNVQMYDNLGGALVPAVFQTNATYNSLLAEGTHYLNITATKNSTSNTETYYWQFTVDLTGTLTGYVLDTNGAGIANVNVTIYNATNNAIGYSSTYATGEFKNPFTLSEGFYSMNVTADSYTRNSTLFNMTGQDRQLNISSSSVPDAAIYSLNHSVSHIVEYQNITFTAVVGYVGQTPKNGIIRLYANNTEVYNSTINFIDNNNNSVNLYWTATTGDYDMKVAVDSVTDESYTADNNYYEYGLSVADLQNSLFSYFYVDNTTRQANNTFTAWLSVENLAPAALYNMPVKLVNESGLFIIGADTQAINLSAGQIKWLSWNVNTSDYNITADSPDQLNATIYGERIANISIQNPTGGGFVKLACPADLLITDKLGMRLGYDADGNFYNEIPGAMLLSDDGETESYYIPSNILDMKYNVIAKGEGDYELTIEDTALRQTILTEPINITGGETFELTIDSSDIESDIAVLIKIDEDGDGIIDSITESGKTVTVEDIGNKQNATEQLSIAGTVGASGKYRIKYLEKQLDKLLENAEGINLTSIEPLITEFKDYLSIADANYKTARADLRESKKKNSISSSELKANAASLIENTGVYLREANALLAKIALQIELLRNVPLTIELTVEDNETITLNQTMMINETIAPETDLDNTTEDNETIVEQLEIIEPIADEETEVIEPVEQETPAEQTNISETAEETVPETDEQQAPAEEPAEEEQPAIEEMPAEESTIEEPAEVETIAEEPVEVQTIIEEPVEIQTLPIENNMLINQSNNNQAESNGL